MEACVSLSAAWIARSPALLAFGGDSAIELLSAVVVLWRYREQSRPKQVERQAARIAGALLFAIAAVVATHALARSTETPVICDDEQRRTKADAAESALYAYLSWTALGALD